MTTQSDSLQLIEAKCIGTISAISDIDQKTKNWVLRVEVGDDYNRTRKLLKELSPECEPLLPPQVALDPNDKEGSFMAISPAEMLIYYHQLRELVSTLRKRVS